ncbi:MAG: ABC transporter ATP-binding protein [bacterium]
MKKIKDTLHLLKAVKLVWQSSKKWFVLRLVTVVFQGILPLVPLYLMKLFVDQVAGTVNSADISAGFTKILLVVAAMAVVALFSSVINAFSGFISEIQSQVVTDRVYDILHAKSLEVDLEYYENPQYYDTLHRAQQQAPYRPTHIVNGLVQSVKNIISIMAISGLILTFNWMIALILLVALIPSAVVKVKFSGKIFRWQNQRTKTERKSWYYNMMLTRNHHAKEIRIFQLGKLFLDRFTEFRKTLRRERLILLGKRSIAESLAQLFSMAAVFGALVYVAYRTIHGNITLGDMVMYYGAFQRGQGYLGSFLTTLAGLYEDNLFLSYLYDFLDIKPKISTPEQPVSFPPEIVKGINFNNIDFGYPHSPRKALYNFSAEVFPGETVALVGENGSGKTTLIKLLCRLYSPDQGVITIDGVDIRKFDLEEYRSKISVIFQDYVKYFLTARENIWFGNIDRDKLDENIVPAARFSGAGQYLEKLEDKYDTFLGKWFEKGEELSVGEWQKIALARAAFSKANILILDEPTSSLDAKSEYEIFDKFKKISGEKIVFLISHRFSTVRMADKIFVLDKGRIIEQGTHSELLDLHGKYAELFSLQAEHYK